MRRSRVTPDELMEQLRSKDITDLRQVQYAVLETDGELNAVLYPEHRPATAADLGISPGNGGYAVIVVNDGRVMGDNLAYLGRGRRLALARAQAARDIVSEGGVSRRRR